MGEKKDRGRFTIKFNENDPAHEAVISILEQQGPRQKARFLVNAVLHYIHCRVTPDIAVPSFQQPDKAVIEAIVMEILHQQGSGKLANITENPAVDINMQKKVIPAEEPVQEFTHQPIDNEMLELITHTMLAFRDS